MPLFTLIFIGFAALGFFIVLAFTIGFPIALFLLFIALMIVLKKRLTKFNHWFYTEGLGLKLSPKMLTMLQANPDAIKKESPFAAKVRATREARAKALEPKRLVDVPLNATLAGQGSSSVPLSEKPTSKQLNWKVIAPLFAVSVLILLFLPNVSVGNASDHAATPSSGLTVHVDSTVPELSDRERADAAWDKAATESGGISVLHPSKDQIVIDPATVPKGYFITETGLFNTMQDMAAVYLLVSKDITAPSAIRPYIKCKVDAGDTFWVLNNNVNEGVFVRVVSGPSYGCVGWAMREAITSR